MSAHDTRHRCLPTTVSAHWRPLAAALLLALTVVDGARADDDDGETSCQDAQFRETYDCRQVILRATELADVAGLIDRYGLVLSGRIARLALTWLEVPIGVSVPETVRQLNAEPGVEADRSEHFGAPECRQLNSAIYELGGGLGAAVRNQRALVSMNAALDRPGDGRGVVVAVLDTGVSRSHSDLAGALITPGIDLIGATAMADDLGNGLDDNGDGVVDSGWGHGTAVAGLIHLVAPAARILPIRVLSDECVGSAFGLAAGIVGAVDAGAHIINASLGAREDSLGVKAALQYAESHGVLVVASGGNAPPIPTGEAELAFPAEQDASLAVTSVDDLLVAPAWVIHDDDVALSAPGVDILVPYRAGYGLANGSSFSTAFVSGAAAVALAAHPSLGRTALIAHLRATAIPVDPFNPAELAGELGELGDGIPDFAAIVSRRPAPAVAATSRPWAAVDTGTTVGSNQHPSVPLATPTQDSP